MEEPLQEVVHEEQAVVHQTPPDQEPTKEPEEDLTHLTLCPSAEDRGSGGCTRIDAVE